MYRVNYCEVDCTDDARIVNATTVDATTEAGVLAIVEDLMSGPMFTTINRPAIIITYQAEGDTHLNSVPVQVAGQEINE